MEISVVKFFNQWGRGSVDAATDWLSRVRYLFVFWVGIAFLVLLIDSKNRSMLFVSFLVATVAHFLISEGLIKRGLTRIWGVRQRPYVAYPQDIMPIGRRFSDSSFPSSHLSSTLAMLTVIGYFYPMTWAVSVVFVLLMSFARLHNGMHYVSDIVVGIVLGIAYGRLGIYVAQLFLLTYAN